MSDARPEVAPRAAPGAAPEISIIAARAPDDMPEVRALFLEYAGWLQVDLCFQGFEEELATLPGKYAPPAGGLWFARVDGETAGIVGLRPLEEPGVCELKRLWVRDGFRGLGLGRKLTVTALAAGEAAGYARICLDTLPMMDRAQALYRDLGFREIPAYYHNPEEGTLYLERSLGEDAQVSDTRPG